MAATYIPVSVVKYKRNKHGVSWYTPKAGTPQIMWISYLSACDLPLSITRPESQNVYFTQLLEQTSYTRFPFYDKLRLQQWVADYRWMNCKQSQHSRLCAHHFEHECFQHDDKGKDCCAHHFLLP